MKIPTFWPKIKNPSKKRDFLFQKTTNLLYLNFLGCGNGFHVFFI